MSRLSCGHLLTTLAVAAVAFMSTAEAADVAAEERLIHSQPSWILATD